MGRARPSVMRSPKAAGHPEDLVPCCCVKPGAGASWEATPPPWPEVPQLSDPGNRMAGPAGLVREARAPSARSPPPLIQRPLHTGRGLRPCRSASCRPVCPGQQEAQGRPALLEATALRPVWPGLSGSVREGPLAGESWVLPVGVCRTPLCRRLAECGSPLGPADPQLARLGEFTSRLPGRAVRSSWAPTWLQT